MGPVLTFDARRTSAEFTEPKNLAFGGLVLGVVAIAFFLVLKGPDLAGGTPQASAPTAQTGEGSLHAAFPDAPSRAYFSALHAADPKSYAALEKRLAATSDDDTAKRRALVMESAEDLVRRNLKTLAQANASHLDAMLNLGRRSLKSASRSGSPFCRGSKYASLAQMNTSDAERLFRELSAAEDGLYGFGLEMNTLVARAVADARANPVQHGKVNAQDKAALQGVIFSLMSDPQITPLIMAGNSAEDPEAILRRVNVCEIGDTLLAAMRTLPQDTKGRIWAQAMSDAGSSNPLAGFGGIGGF